MAVSPTASVSGNTNASVERSDNAGTTVPPMPTDVTDRNLATVRRICEHWHELALEEWEQLCDPALDYRNIPMEGDEHHGPAETHAFLSRFTQRWSVRPRLDQIVGDDRVVMAERTEFFEHLAGTKSPFALPVMGVFELRDGRVTAWRDYFDLSQMDPR